MRLLLDTNVLLWALTAPKRLGKEAQITIEDAGNEVMFSAASIREITIKASLKRSDFQITPDEIAATALDSGFTELPVRSAAAAHTGQLPAHHRDPFDRLLIAQAITEPAMSYTANARLEIYSELVHRI